MKRTTLTEQELLERGFVKRPLIIHPSWVERGDELFIGQIDESGNRKDVLVYELPKGFRFDKHIFVNYRKEILMYTSGFMAGGIEVFRDTDDSKFYYRETEEWKDKVREIIAQISE